MRKSKYDQSPLPVQGINFIEKDESRQTKQKKKFYDQHPWISGFIISAIVAFLFTFWTDIIAGLIGGFDG